MKAESSDAIAGCLRMRGVAMAVVLVVSSTAHAVDPNENTEVEIDPGSAVPPPPAPPEPQREVDLLPRLTLAETVGWILVPEPEPSDPEELAERELDRRLAAHVMRNSMEHIGADGWYHAMGAQIRDELRIDSNEMIQDERRGMNTLQRLVAELGRYANGPSAPQGGPAAPTPEMLNPHDPNEQWHSNYQDHVNLRNAPVNWYRVEVRITQAPDGDLLAVWITRSSGNRVVDRVALNAVRQGSTRVPPPPPEILGQRRAIVSEWAIEIGDVATMWGQAGCVMGGVRGQSCTNGTGRGIIRTRMQLLRVIDHTHPTFEERRARRNRRARNRR